ncbi:MBL fold metallo-hydrolase [uncultured Ruegeria sp.]|uniref:MBL fold metallo-hydrolase n=1 Tax=uncultured Ruegeria sp. TaxID=259304 RepID=UPI00260396B3|nr:MBL fold metallo-hydrolase [uncultured Ruegeria sp.]
MPPCRQTEVSPRFSNGRYGLLVDLRGGAASYVHGDHYAVTRGPNRSYFEVEGDVEIGPGLTVLAAPGHAPGQIAMMVDLPSGAFLLTSDAISRSAEIDEKFAGSWDEQAAIASADRLMRLASQRDAFVIYGHCPEQWPELKKAPEFYR